MKYLRINITKRNLLLILAMTLFGKLVCLPQDITYHPIGDNDKPLPEIRIKQKCGYEEPARFIQCFQLDSNRITLLASYIKKYKFNRGSRARKLPFGSYEIIITYKNKKETYVLHNKKESYRFFKNQLYLLKDNAELNVDMQNLMKRLE